MTEGARVWLIPDGYLPERSQGDQPSHEAICVLNTGLRDATLRITFYFEDRPPLRDVEVVVARRAHPPRPDRRARAAGWPEPPARRANAVRSPATTRRRCNTRDWTPPRPPWPR